MRFVFSAILCLTMGASGAAFAAGSDGNAPSTDSTKPPKATKTTKTCFFGRVYDPNLKKCVKPQKDSSLDPDTLYRAVRELAYFGRLDDAQSVLAIMPDQNDDRVLTYWGFTHRKLGNRDLADAYYERALAVNPDNILARSYMGQGFVESGDINAAVDQWQEIMERGGEGSWAEVSLRDAIRTGVTYSY